MLRALECVSCFQGLLTLSGNFPMGSESSEDQEKCESAEFLPSNHHKKKNDMDFVLETVAL